MAQPTDPEDLVRVLDDRLRALEALGGDRVAVMASDGDGCLWQGDIGDALFETAIAERMFREQAAPALFKEAVAHGIEEAAERKTDANALAELLFVAHRDGRYPNGPAFAMMAWAFAGFRVEELRVLSSQVLDAYGFEADLRPELEPMHRWRRANNIALFVVSASPHCIVAAAAARMGIAADHVVAMDPARDGDILLPRLDLEPTYRDGKMKRLREQTEAPLLAGFGDSYWDLALIEGADVGVAVFPKPRLRKRMAELTAGWILDGV